MNADRTSRDGSLVAICVVGWCVALVISAVRGLWPLFAIEVIVAVVLTAACLRQLRQNAGEDMIVVGDADEVLAAPPAEQSAR